MVKNFEIAFSQWLAQMLPTATKVVWGGDSSVYDFSRHSKYLPFITFTREEEDDPLVRSFDHFSVEENRFVKLYEMPSKYTARIFLEKRSTAIEQRVLVRTFIEENPYVPFLYMGDLIKIGTRLLYINLKDERDSNDIKGTLRYLEVGLLYNILISELYAESSYQLIEGITVGINSEAVTYVKLADIGWAKI